MPAQAPVEVNGLLRAGQGVTQIAGGAQDDGEAAQSQCQPRHVGVVVVPGQTPSDPDRFSRDRDPLTHAARLAQAGRHDGQALSEVGQVGVRGEPGQAPENLACLPCGIQRLPTTARLGQALTELQQPTGASAPLRGGAGGGQHVGQASGTGGTVVGSR